LLARRWPAQTCVPTTNAEIPLYVQDVLVHQHPAALISASVIWKTLSTSLGSRRVTRGVS